MSERRTGESDNIPPGIGFGSLNSISGKRIKEYYEPGATSFFSSTKKSLKEGHTQDTLSGRGEWKGIVLRVQPPPPEPSGWLRRFFEPLGIPAPVLVKIKVRISELHFSLPYPSQLGSEPGPHQAVIDLYPTFIAKDDTLPVPAVGSVVLLEFEDKKNMEGPIFKGAVGEQAQSIGGGGGPGDQAMSAAYEFARTGNCGPLSAAGPIGGALGMSAGFYSAGAITAVPIDNARRAAYVQQLLEIGGWPNARQGDVAYEQIPYPLVEEMILNGEMAVLALFIGAGNWGISDLPAALAEQDPLSGHWQGMPIPGADSTYEQAQAAGRLPLNSWPGKRAGSGKHVMDGPGGPNMSARGGIGIAHFDSGAMESFYETFAPSPIPAELKELSYDQLNPSNGSDARVTPQIWENWKQWCLQILLSLENQVYMINYWTEKFFELARNGGDIIKTIVNSRIQNSVSGVGGRLAGQPVEAQIQGYYSYKLNKDGRAPGVRGQDAADRAVRQAHFALRVAKCYEHIVSTVPDAEAMIRASMIVAPPAFGSGFAGVPGTMAAWQPGMIPAQPDVSLPGHWQPPGAFLAAAEAKPRPDYDAGPGWPFDPAVYGDVQRLPIEDPVSARTYNYVSQLRASDSDCKEWGGWDEFTPGLKSLKDYIRATFPGAQSIGGYNCRSMTSGVKMSQHGSGRAMDIMIDLIDEDDEHSANNGVGDPIANWLLLNAYELGVSYIIWDHMNYSASRGRLSVRDEQGSAAHLHTNHIHVDFNWDGAMMRTPWFQNPDAYAPSGPMGGSL